ncbi:MAG: IS110 family transposase [Chloroflexi bacterium]|nr:IS110 family transposase [Chloroflexota bacterium]
MQDATARYGSVDWAANSHSACIVDGSGVIVDQFIVQHTAAGLGALVQRFQRERVRRVAIERADGPVVEALHAAHLDVVVVSSRAIKALRTRYGQAGNKADRSDAYVLADCLRTDGHRWPTLQADTPQTVALRATVRARKDLVATRVATANQLRAHLQLVFPGVIGIFAELDSPIMLRFLERFPTPHKASWLSERRLTAWLQANAYSGRRSAAELMRRLRSAPQGQSGPCSQALAAVTLSLVRVLRALVAEIDELERHIREQLALHPDGPLFRSLPRSGSVRAATLLAEMGDCRARFPSAESLAALAGVVPSTRASGQYRAITFRWACDKQLREALVSFAQDTRLANAWAAQLYARHRAQHKSHPHAARILTRAWVGVLWRCWQDRQPYDPGRHHALQRILAQGG